MAESKGFGRIFSKKVIRTKEKVLQNLGKADKTTDDTFDEHVQNLNKQQNAAVRLQKELKNYISCVKAMSEASAKFYTTVTDTYEEDWIGCQEILSAVEQLQYLWDDYMLKLTDQVHNPVNSYVSQFPDMRARIAKRGRKLVDFDSARHNYESLQSAKKKDDLKIQKAQEELNEARQIYMEMNNQMLEELPQLYESRVGFMSSHFNALFSTECKFQEESAKVKQQLSDATERLSKESNVGPVLTLKYKPFTNGEVDEGASEPGHSKFYNIPSSGEQQGHSSRSSTAHNSDARSTSRNSSAPPSPPPPPPSATTSNKAPDTEEIEFPPRLNGTSSPPAAAASAGHDGPRNRLSSPSEQSYENINVVPAQHQKPTAPISKAESSDDDDDDDVYEEDMGEYQIPPPPVEVPHHSFSTMHAGLAPDPPAAKTAEKPKEMPPLPGILQPSPNSSPDIPHKDAAPMRPVSPKSMCNSALNRPESPKSMTKSAPVQPDSPPAPPTGTNASKPPPRPPPRPDMQQPTRIALSKWSAHSDDDDDMVSVRDDDVIQESFDVLVHKIETSLHVPLTKSNPVPPEEGATAVSPPADFQTAEPDKRRFSELLLSMPQPPWESRKTDGELDGELRTDTAEESGTTAQAAAESDAKKAESGAKMAESGPMHGALLESAPDVSASERRAPAHDKDESKPEAATRTSFSTQQAQPTKALLSTEAPPAAATADAAEDRPPALTPPPDPATSYGDDYVYAVAGETTDDDIYRVPPSNKAVDSKVPAGQEVLYKVMATHPYVGEDMDELTFEPGDTVAVIPFEDPEDQDEGWLNGIKESSGESGVFPANFTQKV